MKPRNLVTSFCFVLFVILISKIAAKEESHAGSLWKRPIPFLSNWFNPQPSTEQTPQKFKKILPPFFSSNATDDNGDEEDSSTDPRDPRLLSLFTVVRFDNTQCQSASGDNGTCYPQYECTRRQGAANGKCAQGYGVCCVFSKSCGASTFQNNTYFTHSNYPTAFDGTGSCQMTVYKAARNVCQFRLDFDSFNIAQPNSQGVCSNDQFIISGTTVGIPMICGINSGNHMYIEVGPGNTPVTMSMITSGPAFARTWKIKVTQIRCRTDYKAPEGCLQYFMGVSGTIRSFNFDFVGGQQLANQDYSACIRLERNFCGIRYAGCVDTQTQPQAGENQTPRSRAFSLTGSTAVDEAAGSKVGAMMCNTDWITIPCATNNGKIIQTAMGVCQDRICGTLFNSEAAAMSSPVFSYVRPFRLTYHTDGNELNDVGNHGFCLTYIQQPCTPNQ